MRRCSGADVAPNLQAEAAAFCELSKILADDPCVALRRVLDVARSACHAGSAGLSLLRDDDAGRTIVHWAGISGALAAHEGTDTPRDSSPCGLSLETGKTIRVSRPQRTFASLRATQPEIVEDLIVPLYDNAEQAAGHALDRASRPQIAFLCRRCANRGATCRALVLSSCRSRQGA